ncbi:hypothetical protein I4641_16235 [Waterburya agarophytonicola K14]|uniref:Mobilization protein MobC n=1 Tax=Waterburya agarophytonicola KI4 TaxID=2874699 RepID=A0A964FG32_9CYAN|nr:hypothetical protein [Waterburya agarophytonicola]MCC0178525.1 hypothetical protein [Waterburya agarophytonicola KI4]
MVKAKPNQKIHVDKLAGALDKLDQLESKPKEELTLRESIYFLRDKLNSALKKGYNYEDLSEILAEQEILVSASTLKLYLTDSSKKSKSRIKKSKSASIPKPSPQSNSGSLTSKLSTNITDSKEELGISNSETEINSMEDSTNSEQAVNLNSTTRTKSSSSSSATNKAKAKSQSIDNKSNATKTKVLSGSDDDLSSEFNSF